MAGLIKSHRKYSSHVDKSRAAIIITNNNIDAVLIKQLSNPDTVFIELRYNNTRLFAASIYFDTKQEIERNWTR
jgi:hypothetical protein